MLRFQRHDVLQNNQGLYPELVLINSHDGLSSYRLMAGLFRVVCSNGMIAGQAYNEIRIKHQGDVLGNVIEGTYKVIETANDMLDVSDDMASIHLNDDEKMIFAEAGFSTYPAQTCNDLLNILTTIYLRQSNPQFILFSIQN